MKAVICAIAKFEYNYIYEWVEYHLNLGFDKIVIYDNNDIDGERYDDLLSEFIKKGQVELRDVRGKRAMQRVVYNEFYHEGDFDWVAIIDIDEFISPNRAKYKSIKELIAKNSEADAIFLYWQTYGDAGKTYVNNINAKTNKPISILNQYSIPADKNALIDNAIKRQNAWGKSIIKGGLPIKYLHEHFVTDPNNLKYVDCFGNRANPYLFYPDENFVESTYKECYIKHIYTKSLFEYIDCKVRRPAANSMSEMHFPSKYFKVNEITEEKRKYLESIGYKMDFVFRPDAYVIIEVKNLKEYLKLRPYIYNIINLCSCRFNLCVTEEKSAVDVIYNELADMFNECCIYFNDKGNVLTEFCSVFYNDRKNVVEHSNCIVHMNIPYNVDIDDYIQTYIDPLFNKNIIKHNFTRVFNTTKCLFIAENSISDIDPMDETFIKYKKLLSEIGIETNLSRFAETGNFIIKTEDVLKWKNTYYKLENELQIPELLLYFISGMVDRFIYNK